jgi:hypothetical protein
MMRKAIKVTAIALIGLSLLVVAYLALLFFPGVLFAKQFQHGNFTVHSQTDLHEDMTTVLRQIEVALATSTIHDPTLQHDIFFGHDNSTFRHVQSVRTWLVPRTIGLAPSLTFNASAPPWISHIVTFRVPDVPNNALRHPQTGRAVNLTQILTHEVVHTLLMARFGVREIATMPMWKQEGYADYVAASASTLADPDYTIRDSVERFLANDISWLMDGGGGFTPMNYGCIARSTIITEEGFLHPACYYISRVLMEYLFNVKGMSFDEVMQPGVTDHETLDELLTVYFAGTL